MRYDYDLLLRSFLLYHRSVETDRRYLDENFLAEFKNPILSLKKCLPEPEIKFILFHFFEIAGYYSDAEDLLFELADDNYKNIKKYRGRVFLQSERQTGRCPEEWKSSAGRNRKRV